MRIFHLCHPRGQIPPLQKANCKWVWQSFCSLNSSWTETPKRGYSTQLVTCFPARGRIPIRKIWFLSPVHTSPPPPKSLGIRGEVKNRWWSWRQGTADKLWGRELLDPAKNPHMNLADVSVFSAAWNFVCRFHWPPRCAATSTQSKEATVHARLSPGRTPCPQQHAGQGEWVVFGLRPIIYSINMLCQPFP